MHTKLHLAVVYCDIKLSVTKIEGEQCEYENRFDTAFQSYGNTPYWLNCDKKKCKFCALVGSDQNEILKHANIRHTASTFECGVSNVKKELA